MVGAISGDELTSVSKSLYSASRSLYIVSRSLYSVSRSHQGGGRHIRGRVDLQQPDMEATIENKVIAVELAALLAVFQHILRAHDSPCGNIAHLREHDILPHTRAGGRRGLGRRQPSAELLQVPHALLSLRVEARGGALDAVVAQVCESVREVRGLVLGQGEPEVALIVSRSLYRVSRFIVLVGLFKVLVEVSL